MNHLFAAALTIATLGGNVYAQGLQNAATASDWEEINFEFNQSVIVDGFPSMLRLAELLKQHPDFKVSLAGHADQIGGNRANDRLALARANAVSQFLQHYGATAAQIQATGEGKRNPEVTGRDVNSRFINRRVTIRVAAPDGKVISEGTIAAAIEEFQNYTRTQLGKLDGIIAQLQSLEAQVRALQSVPQDTAAIRQDTSAIRQDTSTIRQDTGELVRRPPPLTAEQTTQIARTEALSAADYALTQSALRNRKYSLLGAAWGPTVGPGRTGDVNLELYGKALIPFGNGKTEDDHGTHGLQAEGDWIYYHQRSTRRDGVSDGIFNVGLVNRFNHLQVGTFAQFDYVNFNFAQGGALLGAGILTVDWLMPGGTIGIFGGKGFRQYANVGSTALPGGFTPYYLRYEDQIGFHANAAIFKGFYLESSVAYKKRYSPFQRKLPAAMVKFLFPVSESFAMYVAAEENSTFQTPNNAFRLVAGFQFGRWLRPRENAETTGVVPVSVPRPHYELLPR